MHAAPAVLANAGGHDAAVAAPEHAATAWQSDLTCCMPPLQFQRELAAMTLLSQHRNVLPLLGACMQPDLAALVTPYCPRWGP